MWGILDSRIFHVIFSFNGTISTANSVLGKFEKCQNLRMEEIGLATLHQRYC